MFARSSSDKGPPEVSIATITTKPNGQHVMQFTDLHRNKWDIPIEFRAFEKRDGSKAMAFDGCLEIKDGNGGSGLFSIRLSGCLMADGSLEGSTIKLTSPGYQSSEKEQVSIQKFTLKMLEAGQVAPSDGDSTPK